MKRLFLYQPTRGYRFNSDTIFLYDFIRRFKVKGRLLDVGCGVGILGLLLTRDFSTETVAVDKQERMCAYAKRNFALNTLLSTCLTHDFTQVFSDLGSFDFIVSNPPFYDPNVDQSKQSVLNIARYAHHLPLETLVRNAKRLLKPRGYFLFCYDAKQVDRVLSTLVAHKLNPEVLRFVHPKIDREAKLVMVAARSNSKSMCKVLPPLIVFDKESNYLPEAEAAFAHAATHVIGADED